MQHSMQIATGGTIVTNEGMCDDLISIIIPIYNRAEYLKKCVYFNLNNHFISNFINI